MIISLDDNLFYQILSCKWEIREISGQTNPYVDTLLGLLVQINQGIQSYGPDESDVALPAQLQLAFWKEIAVYLQEQLVDAYAHIEKVRLFFYFLLYFSVLLKAVPVYPWIVTP